MTPTIGTSFIMAARNAEATIATSIRSVLETDPIGPIELIVVDDASDDATHEVAREIRGPISVVRSARHIGRSQARHEAIRRSRYDFIAVQDADDYSLPERLRILMECVDEDHQAVGGQVQYVSSEGTPWRQSQWPTSDSAISMRLRNFNVPVPHPTLIFSRRLYEATGGYDSRFAYAEDLHLMLRMSKYSKFKMADTPVANYTREPRDSFKYLLRTEQGRSLVVNDLAPAQSPTTLKTWLRTTDQFCRQAVRTAQRRVSP